MHMQGEGTPPSAEEAAKWFTQAADQGDPEGQVAIGMLHALGRGVEPNLVLAHKWITLSADQGNPEAKAALAQLATKLTAGQLENSKKLIEQWKAKPEPKPTKADPAEKSAKTAKK